MKKVMVSVSSFCGGDGCGRGSRQGFNPQSMRVNCHALCTIVCLVDADQSVCQLKHVVTETDYDELRVLCSLLKQKI